MKRVTKNPTWQLALMLIIANGGVFQSSAFAQTEGKDAKEANKTGVQQGLADLVAKRDSIMKKQKSLETKIKKLVYERVSLQVRIQQVESQSKDVEIQKTRIESALATLSDHVDSNDSAVIKGKTYTNEEIVANCQALKEQLNLLTEKQQQMATLMDEYTQSVELLLESVENGQTAIAKTNAALAVIQTEMVKREAGAEGEIAKIISELENLIDDVMNDVAIATAAQEDEWVEIFNGKNLEGWTPKIRGFDFGDNYADTFRVEDGVIKVGYENYEDGFQKRFGHLFYKEKLSHYKLRVEYRFTGDQVEGGPGWAFRNSGVMLHCQDPATIGKDQNFPVSIEMQMLGGNGTDERANANLCTPGTHVEMNGELFKPHCVDSTSKTYHGDDWVTVEMEVRGDEVIRHILEGETVLEYQKPQLDPDDEDAKPLIIEDNVRLTEGYISLQSESHPVEFRKVELMKLDGN